MSDQKLGRGPKLAIAGVLLCVVVGGLALAIDTPADALLAQIRAIEVPEIPPESRGNPMVMQRLSMIRQAAMQARSGLIGELYQLDPDRPELTALLPERWQVVLASEKPEDARREIIRSIERSTDKELQNQAAFFRVVGMFREAAPTGSTAGLEAAVDDFTRKFPNDDRGAEMYDALAKATRDSKAKAALTARLIATYPNSPVAKMAAIEQRRLTAAGKPFEIQFTDPITGQRVTTESLRGKIVVVDFWATWCGPCLAAMPKMKSLYQQYKDQGVVFIGVSQDVPREEGGFEKLSSYVKANQIEWPQYYDGKPSAIDFSLDWGITAIPAIFVVDADGKIVSADAAEQLEAILPELIAQRQARATR